MFQLLPSGRETAPADLEELPAARPGALLARARTAEPPRLSPPGRCVEGVSAAVLSAPSRSPKESRGTAGVQGVGLGRGAGVVMSGEWLIALRKGSWNPVVET